MKGRVLSIGHAASRSGAPMIQLNFLRWLKEHDDVEFDIDVLEGGPLLPDFSSIAKTRVLQPREDLPARLLRKAIGTPRWERIQDRAFIQRTASRRYDVAYVNTIVPTRQMHLLSRMGVPVICHVHELDFAVVHLIGEDGMAGLLPCLSHIIAASGAVHDYLVQRWRVPESKLSTIHEFTVLEDEHADFTKARTRLRAQLGLSSD